MPYAENDGVRVYYEGEGEGPVVFENSGGAHASETKPYGRSSAG